jgi:hypothetical protein
LFKWMQMFILPISRVVNCHLLKKLYNLKQTVYNNIFCIFWKRKILLYRKEKKLINLFFTFSKFPC